jgi:hypothetical protein
MIHPTKFERKPAKMLTGPIPCQSLETWGLREGSERTKDQSHKDGTQAENAVSLGDLGVLLELVKGWVL